MEILLVYLLVGTFVGIIAGLFGAGGGLIIVPVLALLFQQWGFADGVLMHLAIGTSLATIVVTAIASMHAHHGHGAVDWSIFRRMTPGIVVGALLGAIIADFMPTQALRLFFGIFEIAVATQIGFQLMASPQRTLPGTAGMTVAGVIIGALSAIVGIGGGTLTTPFLVWCNTALRKAVATSSAVGFPIAVAGAAGFGFTGWNQPQLPAWSSGYIYWPALAGIAAASVVFAPLGARLAHTLPVHVLRRLLAIFLAVLGIRMLLG